jgi:hypothetical protein
MGHEPERRHPQRVAQQHSYPIVAAAPVPSARVVTTPTIMRGSGCIYRPYRASTARGSEVLPLHRGVIEPLSLRERFVSNLLKRARP